MNRQKSDEITKSDKQATAKRPYDRPRLTVYGDLRLRTWTTLSGGMNDGGAHPNHKTV